jgi:LuxR family maltose regulon positive regulatory protein
MANTQSIDPLKWLAATKFHPPRLREDVIHRQRLLGLLYQAVSAHPLTLISAPAGYGKTTLLAALRPTYPDLPLAWLSLDEEDNDPARFLTALIVALQQLEPTCGATAQTLLAEHAHLGVDVRRVTSVLINDVLETRSQSFTLVLDDPHRITEPSVFVALDYLLEHRPPPLHLVIATRSDPPLALARLRARGELAELRLKELRFSREESGAFLNERLDLGLSAGELAMLQTRTEGWPVGLRLLASSLDRVESAEERRLFIQHPAQSDRNVIEFLAEEVFNRQETEVKVFLLETAILPRLTSSLCRAVTQRADAGVMLEELYRRNLFLVQASFFRDQTSPGRSTPRLGRPRLKEDSRPEIEYRYHELFAEFLRQKLERRWPERVPELHLRAARAESDPARAVGHFLAAAKWHEAADIIEQVERDALQQGFLDTLSSWINALPDSILKERPRLIHTLGTCALQRGELVIAQSMLRRALAGYERADMDVQQSQALADLASCAFLLADFPKSEALYARALTQKTPANTRLRILMERASLGVFRGKWKQAQEDFASAVGLVQEPLDPESARMLVYQLVPGQVILPGAIDHMERFCRLASSLIGDEISPMRVHIEGWMALIHGWRGRWSKALLVSKRALAMDERLGGHLFAGLDTAAVIIAACGAIGVYRQAEPYLDLLFRGVKHMDFAEMYIAAFLFVPGRLLWMQGRLDEARQVFEQMRQAENPRELPVARVMRAWLQALLEAADGQYASAERTLRQPFVLEQSDRISTLWGSTRLMLARLYLAQNRQAEAIRELEVALPYYEGMGWPGSLTIEGFTIVPLLELAVEQGVQAPFASQLLGQLGVSGAPGPLYVPQTGQTLTRREVEVLQLISAGATNQDIVDELVVSMSTAKAHVSHILNKLAVSNRTKAASRAREWRLL